MRGFILRTLISALGLWAASAIVPGVDIRGGGTLLIAAILYGVVNALVRPVLVILTFPLTLVTLGLFLLVVNAAMFGLVAAFLGQGRARRDASQPRRGGARRTRGGRRLGRLAEVAIRRLESISRRPSRGPWRRGLCWSDRRKLSSSRRTAPVDAARSASSAVQPRSH